MSKPNANAKPPWATPFSADAIVECMTDGFVAFDFEWRYTYVNAHAARLFGTTPECLIGRKYLECFPEAEGTRFQQAYQKAMQERVAIDIEEYFPPWKRWFENHIYPTPDGISIFFHEITDRKKVEADLHRQQQLTGFILDALPVNVYLKDQDGRYLMANEECARTLGISRSALLGKTDTDIFPQAFAASVREEDRHVLATGQQSLRETSVTRGSHEQFFLAGRKRVQLENDAPKLLGFAIDITDRKKSELQARYLAHHDSLTGLPNRSLLEDRLARAVAHAHRNGRLVAVMFLDLDRFKTINDSLGHKVGDELLQIVAARLRSAVREEDTVARLGGDEFVILLEDIGSEADVTRVAEKVLAQFERPVALAKQELQVATSIGISLYPRDHQNPDTLLKDADIAMYQAKAEGGRRHRYFDLAMNASAFERLVTENGLRKALELDQLALHYQPYINLETGQVIGMEALVRWNRPGKGLVSPDDFIPIAEESGLIIPLGEKVLRHACRQHRQWLEMGLRDMRMSVNLSVQQFRAASVVEMIRSALQDTGTPPSLLQLEITETGLMHDVERARAALAELARMGVELAIDDFGTGYSSLAYLKTLPLHKLKVDRSFVNDVATDKDDAAIVVATIGLAHNMGLKVIAEGVENPAQLAFLADHRCDEGQGYYFSSPLEPQEMETFIFSRPGFSPGSLAL